MVLGKSGGYGLGQLQAAQFFKLQKIYIVGLFSNIFKKKPGGTLFGNLLRGAASHFTGGMLGSGANRIELGQTQTNAQIAAAQAEQMGVAPPPNPALAAAAGVVMSNPQVQQAAKEAAFAKAKPFLIGGGIIAAIIALVFVLKPKTHNKGRR